MFEVKAEIQFNRPIEDVFAFIADNENDPKWCVPVVVTTRVSGEKPGLGARYTFSSRVGPFKPGGQFEITAFEPNVSIGWRGTSTFGSFSGHYQLAAKADSVTHLEQSAAFEMKGIWRLFEPTMRPQFAANYRLQLNRLKRLLESTAE